MKTTQKNWTAQEEKRLESEVDKGMSARLIAERHGRTEKSINQKLYKMRKKAAIEIENELTNDGKLIKISNVPKIIGHINSKHIGTMYTGDISEHEGIISTNDPEPNEKPYTDPGIEKILYAIAIMLFVLCAVIIGGVIAK